MNTKHNLDAEIVQVLPSREVVKATIIRPAGVLVAYCFKDLISIIEDEWYLPEDMYRIGVDIVMKNGWRVQRALGDSAYKLYGEDGIAITVLDPMQLPDEEINVQTLSEEQIQALQDLAAS